MREVIIENRTTLAVNNSYEGEMLETQVYRATKTKEPIDAGSPLIYTERNEGVLPQYDIRTDRWDIAIEAMGKVEKSLAAKREESLKEKEKEKGNDGKPEPAQPTK